MSDIAIKIEGLSKQYRLGVVGTGTLSHDLQRWWTTSILGKEDPYLKIGETNAQASKGSSEYVWALRDINLEVKQGEILGIIGKNGAGKSTLLKILSRVTKPTTGSITYKGRIASLLEVGTGFHPEMTGRENIYMNGTIMGMTRWEINQRLDEIIDFAGVARYIDTPVKRYSSGMTVRLGFAIAAHLEPEILVVDEVLAVGDAEFQKKAIGKMQDVSKGEGRTVLFVSHNMASIEKLCSSSVVMQQGHIVFNGSTEKAISHYIMANSQDVSNEEVFKDETKRKGTGEVRVTALEFQDKHGNKVDTIPAGQTLQVVLKFINKHPDKSYNLVPGIAIKSLSGQAVALHYSRLTGKVYKKIPNKGEFRLIINNLMLVPSVYSISYSLVNENKIIDRVDPSFKINVQESNIYGHGEIVPATHGLVLIDGIWDLK